MQLEGKAKILIVDDVETNRIILANILEDTCDILEAANGREALNILTGQEEIPELVLLDVVMPEMDGFEVLRQMKMDYRLRDIPVIFITAESDNEAQGLSNGAVDYIVKPFESEIARMRVSTQLELARHRNRLEHMVEERVAELVATKEVFLETMADLIECRSAESGQHVKRTKDLCELILLQQMKGGPHMEELRKANYKAVVKAVPLHDIGKISIPDNILMKPGKLTEEEFEVIKTHTLEGGKIIDTLIARGIDDDYIRHCRDICLYHHERWDGKGYPTGLAGTDIPPSARVVAVVDVYDALISERCYKKPCRMSRRWRLLRSPPALILIRIWWMRFWKYRTLLRIMNVNNHGAYKNGRFATGVRFLGLSLILYKLQRAQSAA